MSRRLVPLRYPVRSLAVRWQSSLFSALGIGLTTAVLAGVLALREGFQALFAETGGDDVVIYLRPGAQSEGESLVRFPDDAKALKDRPEIARAPDGSALAAAESYLGINLEKADGGVTIVPVRGIEAASVAIQGDKFRIVDGEMLTFGTDEVVVGLPISRRLKNCKVGDTLVFNVTPFKVVGLFEHDGAYSSEIWGDVDRLTEVLKRPFRQRVVAKLKPEGEREPLEKIAKEAEHDPQVPAKVQTEREYYVSQTNVLGGALGMLAGVLTTLMGLGAVLGAANTMLAAVGARTREVGILVAMGYRGFSVFLSFLLEAAAIGLVGGAIGSVLVLPLNGVQTGTTNFATFTEVAFAFRVTPGQLLRAIGVAVVLGLLGGAVPAWRASRLVPTEALRRL